MRCTDVLLGKTRSKFEAWSLLRNKVFVCFPLMTTEPGGNCELGNPFLSPPLLLSLGLASLYLLLFSLFPFRSGQEFSMEVTMPGDQDT
jgi:hypothetical protein